MKNIFLLVFVIISISAFSQKKPAINIAIDGYRFDHKIKGPKHKRSKALEIMVGNNGNYFVVSYAGPKSYITVNVHNLYTWELVGSYQFKGRAELYNSYFDNIENVFYVNNDIFKNMFKKINLDTHEVEDVSCTQAPRGCKKIEPEIYKTVLFTIGENYYIKRDDERKNYIKIYKKKELFIDDEDYLEENNDYTDSSEGSVVFPQDEIISDTIKTDSINNTSSIIY